jgi:hypothetical protein
VKNSSLVILSPLFGRRPALSEAEGTYRDESDLHATGVALPPEPPVHGRKAAQPAFTTCASREILQSVGQPLGFRRYLKRPVAKANSCESRFGTTESRCPDKNPKHLRFNSSIVNLDKLTAGFVFTAVCGYIAWMKANLHGKSQLKQTITFIDEMPVY